jgi:hypothetical protein
MSYKQRREQIYKIPIYLIAALLVIFIIGILLTMINVFYPNPFSETISKEFSNGYQNIANLVMGAMIASIIGLFSSVAIMDLRADRDRDNLILGFYYELKEINEKIQQIPTDDLSQCARWLHIEKNPIYYDNGLFFVLRKEMFSLEQPFLEKMLSIYSKIIFLEQQWKNMQLEKSKIDPNIITILPQLKKEINDFFPILESEKQKIK